MTYTQTITPNPDISCRPGWCLEYVRRTYGLAARYDTATEAWENSPAQHQDTAFPENVWVPLWFALDGIPAGHVALRAPDGSIYSTSDETTTPHHHPTLDDLLAYYWRRPLTYLGWTEDVAGTPVVTPGFGAISVESADITAEPTPPVTQTPMEDKMLVLATNGTDPQVWIGDGVLRRPVWTLDTMSATQWLAANKVLGPFFDDGKVQTIPDLNSLGIDVMALVGKGVNG